MDIPSGEVAGVRPFPAQDSPSLIHENADCQRVAFTDSLSIGREQGDVRLPHDPYLSQLHAVIERAGGHFVARDCGSTNGTFIRIRGPLELRPGDEILIGGQLFRFIP